MSETDERHEVATAGNVAYPFRVCSISEKGPVRQQNEDSMVHFDSPFGHVVIVADGMGGHGHGDLAAALVVNGFQESLKEQDPAAVSLPDALRLTCSTVNAKIVEMTSSVNQTVMGSTVVMVVLHQAEFYVAHVGDSRAYLLRNGALSRLTKDHSVVQRDVDDGLLTEEQARQDSRSSMLTRAMGTPNGENIEIQGPMPLMDGDGILLCTDGLHGFALDRQIEDAIVCNNLDPQKVTTGLVNLAIGTYFSNDNVTVQYIQIGKPKPLHSVRPVFGRPKRASESTQPGSSPQAAETRRKRSLFSKVLLWLNTLLILAAVGWGAIHPNRVAELFTLPTPPTKLADTSKHADNDNAVKAKSTLATLRVGVVLPGENLEKFLFACSSNPPKGQGELYKIEFVIPVQPAPVTTENPQQREIPKNVTCVKATSEEVKELKDAHAATQFDAIIELKKKPGPQK